VYDGRVLEFRAGAADVGAFKVLLAAVTGTVACQWFKRWSDARAANDGVKEREAIAAMATAKDWPILEEMAKEGGYPEVLLDFAAAMPAGDWYGRPLAGDVNSGLGRDALGVDLPNFDGGAKP
jgi:uncharacterized protein YodC (DUF2158 family)